VHVPRLRSAKLGQADAQVYGISVDTFLRTEGVSRSRETVVSAVEDFNKQVIREYGVFNED
jgi:peroxiredoxin